MSLFRRKRLWSRGREGVYLVNVDTNKSDEDDASRIRPAAGKRLESSRGRCSLSPASSLVSFSQFDREHRQTTASKEGPSQLTEFKKSWSSSSSGNSLDVDEVWDSMSSQSESVTLLSTPRLKSVRALQQIEVDVHEQNFGITKGEAETARIKPRDTTNDRNVEDMTTPLSERSNEDERHDDSDSESSTKISDSSEKDVAASSNSESDDDGSVFDFDAYIKRLCDRENDSDTESDENYSNASDAALKKAVKKVLRKIKRERSNELADSEDGGSHNSSEKRSDDEESTNSDDQSTTSDSDTDDETDISSPSEMEKDVDPEIAELIEGGLIMHPINGKTQCNATRLVYRYYLTKDGKIDSVLEKMEKVSDVEESSSNETKDDNHLASTLDTEKVQDLRWPFSSYYVKEVQNIPVGEEDVLPSYRSTEASASFPGRSRNVMLGRVWWVEWWAREDTKMKSHSGSDIA